MSTSAVTPSSPAAPATPAPVASAPEVAQGGQQAPPEPQTAADPFENLTDEQYEKLVRKRKHKVKVDKEEQELDYDELKAGYQLKKHSHKQLQAAAESRKQIETLLTGLKGNPVEGLRKLLAHPALGLDARKLATELLAEELEAEQMDPKDRESRDLKRKLAEYEARDKQAAEEAQEREASEFRKRMSAQIENEILAAIEPSGLPASEGTFKRVIFYMKEAARRNINVTAEAAVKLVREDYETEHRDLLSRLPPERVAELLGEEVLGKVQGHLVNKFKSEPTPVAPRTPKEKKPADDTPKPSFAEAMERYRQKVGRG